MHGSSRARVRRALALSLLLACTACGHAAAASPPRAPSSNASYTAVPGAPLGPATQSVRLTTGGSWSYRDTAASTLTLLYFGYTSCPDICPLTMADVARATASLTATQRAHVRVVFVSTDPRRDTMPQLRGWLGGFDTSFAGGRAPIGSVVAAARTYGISIEPPRVLHGDYQVAHGAEVLVLRPGGGMVGYFRAQVPWTAYAQELPRLLRHYVAVS